MFPSKFRAYDKENQELLEQGDGILLCGDGTLLKAKVGKNQTQTFPEVTDRFELSWYTEWTDRNGDDVYSGDIVKRVRDLSAESEKEWLKKNDPDVDIESFVQDYSGALGLIHWQPGGWFIRLLKGHKWAFHGPEGGINFDWEKEIEIIGNKWQNKIKISKNGYAAKN